MSQDIKHVRIEEIDWTGVLPSLCLFRSFRMALHPSKLLVSLLLVVLIYLSGCLLDAIWGPRVYPEEITQYSSLTSDEYARWSAGREEWVKSQLSRQMRRYGTLEVSVLELVDMPDRFSVSVRAIHDHYAKLRETFTANVEAMAAVEGAAGQDEEHKERRQLEVSRRLKEMQADHDADIRALRSIMPGGVFDTTLRFEVDAFERLVQGALSLNLGVTAVIRGDLYDRNSIAGALREMFVVVPAWLLTHHRGFTLVWCLVAWVIWSLLGGAISRMCALDATKNRRISPALAVRYALSRWGSYAFTPFVAIVLALAFVLVLWGFGLVFYGLPWISRVTNMAGSLLFILPLLLGLVVTLLLVGLVFGGNLFYPAIAVEGTDGFDATSRAYNYVIARPWHLLAYTLVSLVYGAATYVFLGTVFFFALSLVQGVVGAGAGVFLEGPRGGSPFSDLLPPPELGRLIYRVDHWRELGATGAVAAVFTMVWVYLFIGLLAAYAVSFYFNAQTWIYLLLRRWVDGTDLSEVHETPELEAALGEAGGTVSVPPEAVPDEVEKPESDSQA